MNVLDAIFDRHSYRGAYQPTPIPREYLTDILRAGMAAPSGSNKQTTSFIAVDDPQVLAKLHGLMDHPVGTTAPAMICVLTQKIPAYQGHSYYIQDYAAAIENMLLAIQALGYGSCWVEGYVTDDSGLGQKMAAALGVPEDYELVAYLPVGIPADTARRAGRKPFDERAWFNGFGNV